MYVSIFLFCRRNYYHHTWNMHDTNRYSISQFCLKSEREKMFPNRILMMILVFCSFLYSDSFFNQDWKLYCFFSTFVCIFNIGVGIFHQLSSFLSSESCHSLEEISSKHTPYQQHNTSIHRTHCFFFHTFYLVPLHLPSFHFIFFASRIICGNLPFFHPYLWFKDAQSSGIDGYREKDHHQPKNGQSQSSNQQQHWRRPIHFSITNHESGLQWCIYCITVPANGPAIESVPSSTDPVQPSSTNFSITINNFETYCHDISIILIITNRN